LAVDHNNIDAGRPLAFDDAEAIARREKTVDLGVNLLRRGSFGVGSEAEFRYGFAPNSDFSLAVGPRLAPQRGGARRLDAGDIQIGVFHNFNRELPHRPALSLRAIADLPTGRGSDGLGGRLRGIASRRFRRFDRLHLNLDLGFNGRAARGVKTVVPGVILGWSHPLGYPRSFNQTLLAQIGVRGATQRGQNPILNLGVGLRRQVSVRSVFDLGLTSDLSGGTERESLGLIAGYSTQF
jgi:hypothetical protein